MITTNPGRIWPSEISISTDPVSGATVRQLTNYRAHSNHSYFTYTSARTAAGAVDVEKHGQVELVTRVPDQVAVQLRMSLPRVQHQVENLSDVLAISGTRGRMFRGTRPRETFAPTKLSYLFIRALRLAALEPQYRGIRAAAHDHPYQLHVGDTGRARVGRLEAEGT